MNEKKLPNEFGSELSSEERTQGGGFPAHERDSAKTERVEQTPTERGAFVIAIANQKGGVAKTTSVVSLGGALVQRNKDVLLIDLDAQANLTLALGKDPAKLRGAITDVLFNSASLLSVSRETNVPGLDLVPANSGMDLAERFLPVRKDYETILLRALNDSLKRRPRTDEAAKTGGSLEGSPKRETGLQLGLGRISESRPTMSYDYVILDCPPYMGAVTLNAMIAADMLIIPTQPEFFSAHALKSMMTTIRQVRNQHNPDLVYRILITLYDRRNRIHRDVAEQIRTTFSTGVFETIIEIDTKLRESAVEGLPISHHRSQSRSALQYEALAQELIQYVR
jgi:chromosome partitioning protein